MNPSFHKIRDLRVFAPQAITKISKPLMFTAKTQKDFPKIFELLMLME